MVFEVLAHECEFLEDVVRNRDDVTPDRIRLEHIQEYYCYDRIEMASNQ